MTVYVDHLVAHPTPADPQARRLVQRSGDRRWCHLFTDDEDLTELHRVARAAGMKLEWFQNEPGKLPHYDLRPGRRAAAIRAGAVECDWRMTARVSKAWRFRLRLEAISRRARAASPGPWMATQRFSALRSIAVLGDWSVEVPSDRYERPDLGQADAVFVAAARADVPWLLAQLLEACADANRLRKALTHAAAGNDIRLRAGCTECLLIDKALGPGKLARSSHDQPGGQVASSALAPENPEERR